jgi:hypothetical protein
MIEFVRGSLAAVARTLMRHPDHDLRITLYPIFHVGSAAFYDALSEDLRRFHVFLLEGVRWKGLRGPLYDLAARNVGLVSQRERLRLPEGAERLSLDMSEVEFTREAGALPLHWRLLLRFLRPVLWVVTLTASGRHALWDAISKEKYARRRQAANTPLEQLIKDKRDRAMCDVLRTVAQDPARIAAAHPIAVIAGAAHMPALYLTLRGCGYEKGSVRWFEVLDGVTVPSRSTDGRVTNADAEGAES